MNKIILLFSAIFLVACSDTYIIQNPDGGTDPITDPEGGISFTPDTGDFTAECFGYPDPGSYEVKYAINPATTTCGNGQATDAVVGYVHIAEDGNVLSTYNINFVTCDGSGAKYKSAEFDFAHVSEGNPLRVITAQPTYLMPNDYCKLDSTLFIRKMAEEELCAPPGVYAIYTTESGCSEDSQHAVNYSSAFVALPTGEISNMDQQNYGPGGNICSGTTRFRGNLATVTIPNTPDDWKDGFVADITAPTGLGCDATYNIEVVPLSR